LTADLEIFDRLPDGRPVERIHLRGPRLSASLLTLGATVQDLRLAGIDRPLVLGFPDVASYLGAGLYVGAIVGRFANRIGHGRFTLDGVARQADRNFLGRHLLHGGAEGTHAQLWKITEVGPDHASLRLDLADGHMGFPGAMRIEARFSVADDSLDILLRAEADAATPCNLAHHGYFDLDGHADIHGHILQIAADHYLPVDDDLIPTGVIAPVDGTAFDFRKPRPVGTTSYDHNFCLAKARRPLTAVARLEGQSGLAMTVETTEPGLQVYDGRHFTGPEGLDGRRYGPYAGLALEAQGWPDAPNRPAFPDTILRPGQQWQARTRYRFGR
jgi:aldose 1-epimerase